MKRILFSFLSTFFALAALHTVQAQDTVSVGRVTSGTTFLTSSGEVIALLGVGMPKSGGHTPEAARSHLELMLSSGQAIIAADSLTADRATGPKFRYVYMLSGEHANLRMITDGYGTATITPEHSKLPEFLLAEKGAASLPQIPGEKHLNQGGVIPEIIDELLDGSQNRGKKNNGRKKDDRRSEDRESASVQCSAITKKGKQCSRTTKDPSGRCWQHE